MSCLVISSKNRINPLDQSDAVVGVDVENLKKSGSNLPTVISNKKNTVSIPNSVRILISLPFMAGCLFHSVGSTPMMYRQRSNV